jgi:SAM-dependent methyltransferase
MTNSDATHAERWRRFEHTGWREAADHYHDWLGGATMSAVDALLSAAEVGPDAHVLDIATGPGYAAGTAARRGANAIGVDFSAEMVNEAKRRYPSVDFQEGDAEDLPFPDSSFDAVVSNFGFLHFSRPELALGEAFRVLRPGGRLALTVWDQRPELDPRHMVQKAVEEFGDPNVAAELPTGPAADLFADLGRCQPILHAVGFVSPAITKLPLTQPTPDPETYLDTVLRGSGPRIGSPLRAQPPEALAAIRIAVQNALRNCVRNGITEVPMPAVLLTAEKPT